MITSTHPDWVLATLSEAQAEFPAIPKRGFNPHFKSKFATLADTKEVIDPILRKHRLNVVQFPAELDGKPALTTLLTWTNDDGDSQYIGDITPLSLTKNDPQAHGSALTYMRRYCYSTILGLLTDEDDDDAQVATHEPPKPKEKQLSLEDLKDAADRAGETKESVINYVESEWDVPMSKLSQQQLREAIDHYTRLAVGLEMKG